MLPLLVRNVPVVIPDYWYYMEAGVLQKATLAALSDAVLDAALSLGTRAAAITVSRAGANPPWSHEL